MITKGQKILLVNKDRKYLVKCEGRFSTKDGTVDLDKMVGKKFGKVVKFGPEKYTVVEPTEGGEAASTGDNTKRFFDNPGYNRTR
jgi:tRNA A58 N-methylase Trm61